MDKQLTITEALNQGYTYCGEDGREDLLNIGGGLLPETLKEIIKDVGAVFLAEKECLIQDFPCASSVLEDIIQNMQMYEHGYDSAANVAYQYKKELEGLLTRMKKQIKQEGATCTYGQTDIKLIP